MGKEGFTPDGKHLQFGDKDSTTMPPGFDPSDDSAFQPQPFGHVVEEDD